MKQQQQQQQRQGPKHVGVLMLILAAAAAPAASFGVPAARLASGAMHSRVGSTPARCSSSWRSTTNSRRSINDNSSSSVGRGQIHERVWQGLGMSYDGGDFPSDVGDDAGSSGSPVVLAEDNPELRETMKREILSIAATSNR